MSKERPIYEIRLTKVKKDTGTPGRPFFTNVAEYKHYYLFGVLIKKVTITGDVPVPEDKK
jgi:hypothetical protein